MDIYFLCRADSGLELFGYGVPVLDGVLEEEVVPDIEDGENEDDQEHRQRCRQRLGQEEQQAHRENHENYGYE